jgi:hypothetical protein
VDEGEPVVEQRADRARQLVLVERAGQRAGERVVMPRRGAGRELEDRQELVVEGLAHAAVADHGHRSVVPAAELRAERGERVDRAAVAGLDRGDLGVGLGGPRGREVVCDDVGVRHAQPRRLARLAGAAGVERRDRLLVGIGGGRVIAGRLGERDDLVLDQLIARRERERAREVGERAGGVVLVLEAELGGLAEQREPGAVVLARVAQARAGGKVEHAAEVAVDPGPAWASASAAPSGSARPSSSAVSPARASTPRAMAIALR